ncbi:MAG: MFS transporter, partial [Planctomycetaceae bacterium]|nr:MFS transporter [Planctomycetaceae bacterium]
AALVVFTFNFFAMQKMLPLDNSVWRCIFLFGSIPAVLAYFVIRYMKEPESWRKQVSSREGRKNAGSVKEMFSNPMLRKHVILGMILASTGVIGAWGIGLFTNELAQGVVFKNAENPEVYEVYQAVAGKQVLEKHSIPVEQKNNVSDEIRAEIKAAADAAIKNQAVSRTAWNLLFLNIGAFFGMYGITLCAIHWGRRLAFTIFMTGCILSICVTFLFMDSFQSQMLLVPIMGFFTMSMFGGYTVYFPELFPTRLRSTGVSFCYNVGRYIAAFGPLVLGALITGVFKSYGEIDPTLPLRYAGTTMSSVFILGIIVVWFLPETKGKPLPE